MFNEGNVVIFAGATDPLPGGSAPVGGADHIAPLPLDAIIPDRADANNVTSTFAVCASHPAFGFLRMEMASMAIGEAAGLVSAMAVEQSAAIQDLSYGDSNTSGTIRYRLLNHSPGQVAPVAPLVN